MYTDDPEDYGGVEVVDGPPDDAIYAGDAHCAYRPPAAAPIRDWTDPFQTVWNGGGTAVAAGGKFIDAVRWYDDHEREIKIGGALLGGAILGLIVWRIVR